MKRILFSLFLMFGVMLSHVCNAQVCKISGTNGDTIEVFASNYDDGNIEITLSNDSQISANVTINVSVTYKNKNNRTETRTYTTKALAKPLQTTIASVKVEKEITINKFSYEFLSYSIDSVTGVKCSN